MTTHKEVLLRVIARYASTITGHRRGCPCQACATVRVRAERYMRRRGFLPLTINY